jgi:hypothetical protein
MNALAKKNLRNRAFWPLPYLKATCRTQGSNPRRLPGFLAGFVDHANHGVDMQPPIVTDRIVDYHQEVNATVISWTRRGASARWLFWNSINQCAANTGKATNQIVPTCLLNPVLRHSKKTSHITE